MTNRPPRIAAIHDLSCIGRCSLCVALPVISSMGINLCPIPTAVLSTQTDGFENFTFVDLTENLNNTRSHFESIGVKFDCIYSGFLGDITQIDIVKKYFTTLKSDKGIIVVDPVMGDHGTLYSTYNKNMVDGMRELIRHADVITPNMTEAVFLLDIPYKENFSPNQIKQFLIKLSDLGPQTVVITGILEGNDIVVYAYDRKNNIFFKTKNSYLKTSYPGTGDLFTSILAGRLTQKTPLKKAVSQACAFCLLAIEETIKTNSPKREGVLFEQFLYLLNSEVPTDKISLEFL